VSRFAASDWFEGRSNGQGVIGRPRGPLTPGRAAGPVDHGARRVLRSTMRRGRRSSGSRRAWRPADGHILRGRSMCRPRAARRPSSRRRRRTRA
jgi:hypothetical protein